MRHYEIELIGGQWGHFPSSPLDFEKKNDAPYASYFGLSRLKTRKTFRLRLLRAENCLFGTARRKHVNFLKFWWFCLVWKIFCWHPWNRCNWDNPRSFFRDIKVQQRAFASVHNSLHKRICYDNSGLKYHGSGIEADCENVHSTPKSRWWCSRSHFYVYCQQSIVLQL